MSEHIKEWKMSEQIGKYEDGCGCVGCGVDKLSPLSKGSPIIRRFHLMDGEQEDGKALP